MRISRHFLDRPLQHGTEITLDGRVAHHLTKVLRAKPGQQLVLFNDSGAEFEAEVQAVHGGELRLAIGERRNPDVESNLQITLAQAVGKGDRMDYALQKATELGVTAIQPLFTERTEVKLKGSRLEKRMDHWRGVLISAAEQSGRVRIPALQPALSLRDWLGQRTDAAQPLLVLHPEADQPLVSWAADSDASSLTVCIGPEGGFSDIELDGLTAAGATAVQLGPRVLRTESAGAAVIAVLQALAGDFA